MNTGRGSRTGGRGSGRYGRSAGQEGNMEATALDLEGNIFGGNPVIRGNVPWQINLWGPAGCGGTLVAMDVS